MLLTITTTVQPATDLGYLLVKHPDKVREVDLTTGKAYVFFPEATKDSCTAALLVNVDPVGLTRRGQNPSLADYVSDRPYAASSFLSVAIGKVFRSAMTGTCKDKPELAAQPLPFTVRLFALSCRGGEAMIKRLFEPLGYSVACHSAGLLDEQFPDWGLSPYYNVTLSCTALLKDVLAQLYVLIPVLDDDKHYFIGDDEVKKLVDHGAGWLDKHPSRELITRRYLGGKGSLVKDAETLLGPVEDEDEPEQEQQEANVEAKLSLNQQRIRFAVEALRGAKTVVDLGCGEGKLLVALLEAKQEGVEPRAARHEKLAGLDIALKPLQIAKWKLRKATGRLYAADALPPKVELWHGSMTFKDGRIEGFEGAAALEVIEHLDPSRLEMFEKVLFGCVHPRVAVVTTPNIEYNVRFPDMKTKFRHRDHQFEWTRAEFVHWCRQAADRFGYEFDFVAIGEQDPEVGSPTQGAVFHAKSC